MTPTRLAQLFRELFVGALPASSPVTPATPSPLPPSQAASHTPSFCTAAGELSPRTTQQVDHDQRECGELLARHGVKGSGLGLAIAHGLVEAMGGTIAADSAGPGRGSTFTVTVALPVATPEEVAAATAAAVNVAASVNTPSERACAIAEAPEAAGEAEVVTAAAEVAGIDPAKGGAAHHIDGTKLPEIPQQPLPSLPHPMPSSPAASSPQAASPPPPLGLPSAPQGAGLSAPGSPHASPLGAPAADATPWVHALQPPPLALPALPAAVGDRGGQETLGDAASSAMAPFLGGDDVQLTIPALPRADGRPHHHHHHMRHHRDRDAQDAPENSAHADTGGYGGGLMQGSDMVGSEFGPGDGRDTIREPCRECVGSGSGSGIAGSTGGAGDIEGKAVDEGAARGRRQPDRATKIRRTPPRTRPTRLRCEDPGPILVVDDDIVNRKVCNA